MMAEPFSRFLSMACGARESRRSWNDLPNYRQSHDMSSFALIRPKDDKNALQASDWGDHVANAFAAGGHTKLVDVDDLSPADHRNIVSSLGSQVSLICYFGHGNEHVWLTGGASTVTSNDFAHAASKAVVSIACKTGCNLGPDAITSGVEAWIGFTTYVAVISPYKGVDPIGDAIVAGLTGLGYGQTMQQSRDELYSQLDTVANEYDTGMFSTHPNANLKYYAAIAMRDHLVLHGTASFAPL